MLQRFPFNWNNPFGYFIAEILQLVLVSPSLEYVGCFMSFAFASMLFAFPFAKDISDCLKLIDQNIKSKKLRSKVMTQLYELIRFTQSRELSLF